LIAQEPLPERDASRLLWLDRSTGAVEHRRFRELPELLQPGDLLVLNDSRVLPARLLGAQHGGGKAEILLLRPLGPVEWECLVRPGRRLQAGAKVAFGELLEAEIQDGGADGLRRVAFRSALPLDQAFHQIGQPPVPPYIRRPLRDGTRYQTVYARREGSAAAPTAGLHFTPALLERLPQGGVALAWITLHIGLDTFRPVLEEDPNAHPIHREWCAVPAATALAVAQARDHGGRIVAGGTTIARTLESSVDEDGRLTAGGRWTDLFIRPGYQFRAVDALLTNFHLPRSTLLMLVAAFAGLETVRRAYAAAVTARYRFYSFGDAMLIT
jgi:S-adenosylmethionine:tRNA ribosyltransferase-isomerase